MSVDRAGEVVAITGGASGVGRAVARLLHERGAEVVLVDRTPEVVEVAAALGSSARAHVLDVTDAEAWKQVTEPGRIDVLVNSAGILGPSLPAVELDLETFEQIVHVNLTGTFVACRAVLPEMIRNRRGSIVNVASQTGKDGNALLSAYSASKAGVIGFTKAVAKEVAGDGVRVNCVAPTVVDGAFSAAMGEQQRADLLAKVPLGRFAREDEVAALIAWASSSECSFTTGFCFDVSGGRSTY